MIPSERMFHKGAPPTGGHRARKKERTRHAIEDAAIELFSERGYDATTIDDIAERAQIAPSTFFRYFPSKADVILGDQNERLPALQRAIIDRPASDSAIDALRAALQEQWVAAIDPDRTVRITQVIASSPVLSGHASAVGHGWQIAASQALARRKGLDDADQKCWMAATVALSTFGEAVKTWIDDGCEGDLAAAVDRGFDTLLALCVEWTS
ncbi:MAG TPA: TetR family transcriptional regulator [Acidimicrobiales bacterium]